MTENVRSVLVLAVCGAAALMLGRAHAAAPAHTASAHTAPAHAAAPEWNPARTHAVQLGPEAGRLMVGFRATAANTVVKSIRVRGRAQVVRIAQAGTSDADAASLASRAGVAITRSRQITPSMHVLYLPKTLFGADLGAALNKLRADHAVEFAEADQRRYPHAAPNDPLFKPTPGVASGQWYMNTPNTSVTVEGVQTMDLSATDAISAWAITMGSSGTVIADVDTGVRFDHPDLLRAGFDASHAGFGGRLLPGYDFVDQDYNATTGAALGTFLIANDGDGWDPDPSDPGDWLNSTDRANTTVFPSADCPISDSSWHGTRVMGVLGALTNNDVGVAGMTWNPYLLPVRSLGKCGGYDSDIIAGIQWAAGLSVSNVPDNPYPADIINLSLGGGTDTCSSPDGAAYQTVLTTVTGMGVLVVISAGNASGAVELPANCGTVVPGVLAVAGLRNVGTKVGYSSFGAEVGVAAPAGNCVNASGLCLRSIDTTVNLGLTTPGTNSYTNEINTDVGTSFSAPIVSGIAALMRAVNANLTPPQLVTRIESSATAFPQPMGLPVCPNVASDGSGECACPNDGTECGAGMVNALSAVEAALAPIGAISATSNSVFDAGASVAACNQTIASYTWTATGGLTIQSGANAAQATVASTGSAGTLMLTVTDAAGHADSTAFVSFTAGGVPTVNATSTPGTAATACPTAMTVAAASPTVSEAFSPASVGENVDATLTINLANSNGFDLTQAGFIETLPAGLSIDTSSAPSSSCAGTAGTLTTSASSVTLSGADIPPNGSCSITLTVKSATAGDYANAIGANALTTASAGGNTAGATASLTVTAPAKSGGGALNWPDMMFVIGVLFARGRRAARRAPG